MFKYTVWRWYDGTMIRQIELIRAQLNVIVYVLQSTLFENGDREKVV